MRMAKLYRGSRGGGKCVSHHRGHREHREKQPKRGNATRFREAAATTAESTQGKRKVIGCTVAGTLGEILITRRVAMRNRAVYALIAGMLLLAGCGKSNTNSMQSATPQQAPAPSNQTAAPQQTPAPAATPAPAQGVQVPTQEQAQAANPANAQEQAPAPPPEPPAPLVVPAGTTLPVILATSISSYKNKAGDEFEGNLAAPIVANGEVAVPKGAKITGTIVDAKKQGKFKGEALLTIRLTS